MTDIEKKLAAILQEQRMMDEKIDIINHNLNTMLAIMMEMEFIDSLEEAPERLN